MQVKYKNLSYLIGEIIELVKGPDFRIPDSEEYVPTQIKVINEYPKTLLLEYQFKNGNKYKRMITKASLYCGDKKLKITNGMIIEPKDIFDDRRFKVHDNRGIFAE